MQLDKMALKEQKEAHFSFFLNKDKRNKKGILSFLWTKVRTFQMASFDWECLVLYFAGPIILTSR